jgi:hypothetical protein
VAANKLDVRREVVTEFNELSDKSSVIFITNVRKIARHL